MLAALLYIINSLLPFRIGLLKFINILVAILVIVVVGFGIYSLVKFNIDYKYVVNLRLYAYIYFAAGLLESFSIIVGLYNKRKNKEK